LMITVFMLFVFNVYGQVYENVERTSSFGLIPVLSDTNERTDGYYLPSLLAANKKGYGYIDCNFTKGGLIVPMMGRTLVAAAWYEHGNTRNMVDIKEIMGNLQPAGPAIPDTRHLMGFAFGANITDKISLGLNFRYLLGRSYEENSAAGVKNSHKIDTDRMEINPSLTFRTGSLFADFGLAINFQWMTENAVGTFEYDRTTTYNGNADFSFFGRAGFKATQYSDIVLSTGFGVLPVHEYALDSAGDKTLKIQLDSYFWNLKAASVIKPVKWMRIHPGLMFSLYHLDNIQKQVAVSNPEKMTSKTNEFYLTMTLGLDVIPVEWFSIKAGVMKTFMLVDQTTSTVVAETDAQDTTLDEILGAYFGPSLTVKGFTFTSLINLKFFTDGPYMITGNTLSDWAYVATVEYQW
ncbi:MAG TPA: hypothetical protein VLJ60_12610, partial [bacterium]|nr:hypothetical protein [bacterium]